MKDIFRLALTAVVSLFCTRYALHAENLALRRQLCVSRRSATRPKIMPAALRNRNPSASFWQVQAFQRSCILAANRLAPVRTRKKEDKRNRSSLRMLPK